MDRTGYLVTERSIRLVSHDLFSINPVLTVLLSSWLSIGIVYLFIFNLGTALEFLCHLLPLKGSVILVPFSSHPKLHHPKPLRLSSHSLSNINVNFI